MVAIFAESLTLGDFLMRSELSLSQQRGAQLPVLTGDLAIFAGPDRRVTWLRVRPLKSESIPNLTNQFGAPAPHARQPSIQKRLGSNTAANARGRAQLA
jgi:hypothetical protein